MAITKTFGIETEYGIVHRGTEESNPISASSVLINSYLNSFGPDRGGLGRVGWDFEDEMPGNDARGLAPIGSMPPEIETHLVNAVLTNGARYYVDHAHPEMSTPECADPLSVVRYDKAGELIAIASMEAANAFLPDGEELVVYKNNSDGKGNSYGTHENYLMDRLCPFGRIVTHGTAHLITRQIFTGSGKVGTEAIGLNRYDIPFQITQRADFFEEEVGLETTLKRPIINTRDEPHADAQKYRRLHVIAGDANMCEVATFLKVGSTGLVLAMVEDDYIDREFRFAAAVQTMRAVSYDLSMKDAYLLDDGTSITALEVQWFYLDLARRYVDERGADHVGGADVTERVLARWETVLTDLEQDPSRLTGQLDWVTKYELLQNYRDRHGLDWDDARLAAMDIQYHDLRPAKSLFARLSPEILVDEESARSAMTDPPDDTRAYFRGECLRRWAPSIVAANWDSLVFDTGTEPLRRIPMLEPTRGTRAHVGTLLEECATPAELVSRLDGASQGGEA
ncbi:MAG: proteasome accessory factor PafA2 [Acidimicrobiales bacterium]|nr:proteasome accessory factor PafA2 [Acidimicrobiales bacterium]